MIEIKFRAWDENRKRIYPVMRMYRDPSGTCLTWATCGGNNEIPLQVAPEECILMQYIGLKDKNGQEIYEDDIVSNGERVGIVKYIPEYAAFMVLGKDEDGPYHQNFEAGGVNGLNLANTEIIGNMHANPGLVVLLNG